MGKKSLLQTAIQMINGLQDAAVLIDRNAKLLYSNELFWLLSGKTKKSVDQCGDFNFLDWYHGEHQHEKDSIMASFKSGHPLKALEVSLVDQLHNPIVCRLNSIPLGEENAPEALILIYRNLTDELRLQKEYRSLLHGEMERGHDLERQVAERTKQLKEALDEVVQLSRIDPLTGLLNRRAFYESALPMLGLISRHQRHGALILSDLDHFKKINDTYGHPAGDAMLVAVAHALKASIRHEDVVCRYGGEEFLIFLSEVKPGGIEKTAQRCLEAIRQIKTKDFISDKSYQQTISLGVALIPEHGTQMDKLISIADTALYQAKHKGRNNFVIAEPSAQL
jgi:diguanylate cyclase (GGDEF)-like protein